MKNRELPKPVATIILATIIASLIGVGIWYAADRPEPLPLTEHDKEVQAAMKRGAARPPLGLSLKEEEQSEKNRAFIREKEAENKPKQFRFEGTVTVQPIK